jgi:hypothetical protein
MPLRAGSEEVVSPGSNHRIKRSVNCLNLYAKKYLFFKCELMEG